jgi:hypothetical protein
MDEDPPLILARAKFSSFAENDEQRREREEVEEWKRQGLMSRSIILPKPFAKCMLMLTSEMPFLRNSQ